MKAESHKKKIGVLGEGAWGTAIATVLAHNGHEVILWCHDQKNADEIIHTRFNNRYLQGVELDEAIHPVTDFAALEECEWIAEAIPTQYLRAVLTAMKSSIRSEHRWIVLSKGFEQHSFLFPGNIITDVFGSSTSYAVVAGPTYAQELARKQVSAAVVASAQHNMSNQVISLLQSSYFKLYRTDDVVGVQVGSALKNVVALGLGMLEGAGYGNNTRAFFLTRGFQEMGTIAQVFGAMQETLYGLSGIGDLVLTAYGGLSKNSLVGKKIGEGLSLDTILEQHGVIPEGVNTIFSLVAYAQQNQLRIPLVHALNSVLEAKITIQDVVDILGHDISDK